MIRRSHHLIASLFFSGSLLAEPPDFEREVLPVLYHHCFSCHSEKPVMELFV
jgi:uncharacterized membrane protein